MLLDAYGRRILTEDEVITHLYHHPEFPLTHVAINDSLHNKGIRLNFSELCTVKELENIVDSPAAWHQSNQEQWHMPKTYQTFDIAKWVLEQCTCDAELQRCGEELIIYADRKLLSMLCYIKYLVDTLRQNNIVWGVGRGSSVASFVLFKIGIHKVNSLQYDLDFKEFMKD